MKDRKFFVNKSDGTQLRATLDGVALARNPDASFEVTITLREMESRKRVLRTGKAETHKDVAHVVRKLCGEVAEPADPPAEDEHLWGVGELPF